MTVGGIKPGAPEIDRNLPVSTRQAPPIRPKTTEHTPPTLAEPPAPRAGSLPADEVTPGQGIQSLIELKRVDERGIDEQFRGEMQLQMNALAAANFSPHAQEVFVAQLSKKLTMPDDAPRLAWIADGLRPALKEVDADISTLRGYFNQQGIRLKPGDVVNEDGCGFQMDKGDFRNALKLLVAKSLLPEGKATRRDVLALLETVKGVGDLNDLAWARNEIEKAERRGLKFADTRTEKLFKAFFDHRLADHAGQEELGLAIHMMRVEGFSDASVAKVRGLLADCKKNDDGLFFAERQLARSTNKALADPKFQSPEAQAHIRKVAAALRAELAPRLESKMDHYALYHELARQYRAGKLDQRAFLTLTTTAATSNTIEQFAVGVMSARAAVQVACAQEMLAAAWSDLCKTISENMSDDTRDASGRIIETASEREVKRMLRQRLVKRLKIEPKRLEALSRRAHLLGSRQRVLSQLYGERDPSRRAGLEAALANVDVKLVDHRGQGSADS
jgi:hypothetical protein